MAQQQQQNGCRTASPSSRAVSARHRATMTYDRAPYDEGAEAKPQGGRSHPSSISCSREGQAADSRATASSPSCVEQRFSSSRQRPSHSSKAPASNGAAAAAAAAALAPAGGAGQQRWPQPSSRTCRTSVQWSLRCGQQPAAAASPASFTAAPTRSSSRVNPPPPAAAAAHSARTRPQAKPHPTDKLRRVAPGMPPPGRIPGTPPPPPPPRPQAAAPAAPAAPPAPSGPPRAAPARSRAAAPWRLGAARGAGGAAGQPERSSETSRSSTSPTAAERAMIRWRSSSSARGDTPCAAAGAAGLLLPYNGWLEISRQWAPGSCHASAKGRPGIWQDARRRDRCLAVSGGVLLVRGAHREMGDPNEMKNNPSVKQQRPRKHANTHRPDLRVLLRGLGRACGNGAATPGTLRGALVVCQRLHPHAETLDLFDAPGWRRS
ncbi:hypothetical protein TSOC_004225 [Tetrabaena socialis]|uniref:Uncharacterized protein n=1 Tax=Tetrabaena socialis TaxID=47790 RepID=A0A2J8A9G1_9CHLO|nr:hypothetical protein TSOC_004225 [Tetrabaena socialis]|eukprot:PNH09159.1 hypothetical protein TSOC_004225 [Tetrabaena socialis]